MGPKLLLFHPGAFGSGDVSFEDDAAAYATSKGFATNQVDYPLCNPQGAMTYSVTVAAAAAADGSPVYTYGDSAGANLAARLAEKGRAKAACSFSPIPWWAAYVHAHPEATVLDCERGYTDAQLDSVSPGSQVSPVPIVVIAGTTDTTAPLQPILDWQATDPMIFVWQYVTGHLGGGPPLATYETPMQRGIDWLATRAGL